MDGPGVIVPVAVAVVGAVCRGWGGGIHDVYCLKTGDIAFSRGNHQVEESRVRAADKVEIKFRGSKGDQGEKEAK